MQTIISRGVALASRLGAGAGSSSASLCCSSSTPSASSIAASAIRSFSSTTCAREAASASASSSTADQATPTTREEAFKAAEARRMASVFYNPAVAAKLSKRQRQVYTSLADEPPMPLMQDHGYLYQTDETGLDAQLAKIVKESENPEAAALAAAMVKRALSTRTGNTAQVSSFRKQEIMKKFAGKAFDTGASRVQVAVLSDRIGRVSSHLTSNKKDKHCKRALGLLTVRRRKLLEHLARRDYQSYRVAIKELGLRPVPLVYDRHLPKTRLQTHKEVNERNRRLKNRVSRGHKGH